MREIDRQWVVAVYITQSTQPGALWQSKGVGWGEGGREVQEGGYMNTYSWFTLPYSRSQHSVVKQLSPNWK